MERVRFIPNEDRVVIAPIPERAVPGGAVPPKTAKERRLPGVVVAVGEGAPGKPVTVKVGDRVLYGEYAAKYISLDGREYLMMRNSDIIGIIPPER